MTAKQQLLDHCTAFVEGRLARIRKNIASVQESLQSETKSSAGDKHETGRAMLQLEREKLGRQLGEAEKMKEVLGRVKITGASDTAALGSLVKTTMADYFLAVSAGEASVGRRPVFCISIATPIGRSLLGKSVGEHIVFGGKEIEILAIE
nr:GreA/GreB family elongation factor [Pseudozobellia thermophila]